MTAYCDFHMHEEDVTLHSLPTLLPRKLSGEKLVVLMRSVVYFHICSQADYYRKSIER